MPWDLDLLSSQGTAAGQRGEEVSATGDCGRLRWSHLGPEERASLGGDTPHVTGCEPPPSPGTASASPADVL